MKKHWKKIAGVSLGLIVALVLLAPVIALKSGYVAKLINENAGINGTIDFDSATLNWFTQTEFQNVIIRDQDGTPAASIGKLSISRNLGGLILYGITDAEIGVDQCKLNVNRNGDGINWVNLMAKDEPSEPDAPLHLRIKLNETEIVFSEDGEEKEKLQGLAGDLNFLPVGTQADEQMIGLQLEAANDLEVQGTIQLDKQGELLVVQSTVDGNKTDLSFLNPLFEHLELPRLAMQISGRTSVRWNPTHDSFTLSADFENFSIDGLGPDQKQLVEGYPVVPTQLNGSIVYNSRLPSGFQFTTAYGSLSFDGILPSTVPPYLDTDPDSRLRMEATLDLAKFAREHPEWVQVREDVELEQGMITLSAFNRMEGDKQRMLVDIRADQLLAKRGEQTIEWKKPVTFSCAFARPIGEESVELEFLECKSEFLDVQGSGSIVDTGSNGKITVKGDLARLKQKLDDFFDLGSLQLAGVIDGGLDWNSVAAEDGPSRFQLQSDSTIQNFNLGFSDEDGWH